MSQITTHVLDISTGRPVSNMVVTLEMQSGDSWQELAKGNTDSDGRLKGLLGPLVLEPGTFRLTFETGEYFALHKTETLYPRVSIVFEVRDEQRHYHIPLLLSPFGYSTYRGS
jgi:5-hydroxyisourate hydrolase